VEFCEELHYLRVFEERYKVKIFFLSKLNYLYCIRAMQVSMTLLSYFRMVLVVFHFS